MDIVHTLPSQASTAAPGNPRGYSDRHATLDEQYRLYFETDLAVIRAAARHLAGLGVSPSEARSICPVPADASALEAAMADALAADTLEASRR